MTHPDRPAGRPGDDRLSARELTLALFFLGLAIASAYLLLSATSMTVAILLGVATWAVFAMCVLVLISSAGRRRKSGQPYPSRGTLVRRICCLIAGGAVLLTAIAPDDYWQAYERVVIGGAGLMLVAYAFGFFAEPSNDGDD